MKQLGAKRPEGQKKAATKCVQAAINTMQRLRHNPPAPLDAYVAVTWTVERSFAPPDDYFDILPDGYVELIFSSGCPSTISVGPTTHQAPPCYLVGLLDTPLRLQASGTLRILGARCYAWAIAPLLGDALREHATGLINLEACWPKLTDDIRAALDAGDAQAAIRTLEQFLSNRISQLPLAPAPDMSLPRSLFERHGQLRLADLAAQRNYSRRQVERQFRAATGVAPKAYSRLLRFESVRNQLYENPAASLAMLAQANGYADQAHLSREFKAFSQQTPSQFARAMYAARTLLAAYNVAFLQDEV